MIQEPTLDFWGVIKIISVIQCLFFSILILTTKSENPKAEKFLVLFLLIFALVETDEMVFHAAYIFQIPHWIGLIDPLAYCLGPLIYLYTSSLTESNFSFRKKHLFYFLPAVILYLIWTPVYLESAAYKIDQLQILDGGQAIKPQESLVYKLLLLSTYLAIFSGFVFLGLSLYKLYKFNIRIRQFYASVEFINLRWLKFLLLSSSIIWFFYFTGTFSSSRFLGIIEFIAFPIFVFLISYYHLRQRSIPVIIEKVVEKEPSTHSEDSESAMPDEEEAVKYAKSGMKDEMLEALATRLMVLVEQQKVYTKNDLSLQELADMMEISTHKLSQLLNEKMNQSFYDFVNYHRVQEVKSKLASDEYSHLKVLALAFDAGFNSKTTFNAAFKKYAGSSPTDYKKSLKRA